MKILIAGGSGFIGHHLVAQLGNRHNITLLSRNKITDQNIPLLTWQDINPDIIGEFDIIINLCGENIGAKRWTEARKTAIMQSRIETTQRLVECIINCPQRPHLYNASAIGIYDSRAVKPCSEQDALTKPINFLSRVAIAWEQALVPAFKKGVAVTILRFGVVLGHDGGMVKKLWWPYRFGLGGKIGSGEQLLSWIHIDDVVAIIDYLLQHEDITGAVNLVAPNSVSQYTFAKTLTHALHRPCFLPMSAASVKMVYGEMGQELLLEGQNAIPKRLQDLNYLFKFNDIDSAVEAIVEKKLAERV